MRFFIASLALAVLLAGCAGMIPDRFERAAYQASDAKVVVPQAKRAGGCVEAALAVFGGPAILSADAFREAATGCLWELFRAQMCPVLSTPDPEPEPWVDIPPPRIVPGTYTPAIITETSP